MQATKLSINTSVIWRKDSDHKVHKDLARFRSDMFLVFETNRSDKIELAEMCNHFFSVYRIQKHIYENMYVKDNYSSMVLKTPSTSVFFRCLETKITIVGRRRK